jgi:hypothetical protein
MNRNALAASLLAMLLAAGGCTSVKVSDPQLVPTTRQTIRLFERRLRPAYRDEQVVTIRQLPVTPTNVSDRASSAAGTQPTTGPLDMMAVGFASITAQSGSDPAQRRLQALRAAKMDAYRNLAEQLYGLELAGETTVAEGRVGGDALRTRFTGTIAGAEIVSLEPLGNDSYQATIRLPAQYVAAARRDRR